MLSEKYRAPAAVIALIGVAVASHAIFIPYGVELWSWDAGPFNLVAEDVAQGRISAFYYNHLYGGALLSLIHGAWLKLTLTLGLSDRLGAHHSFHFGVIPALLACFTFFMSRTFVSTRAAFTVALIPAVGFLSWIVFYSATEYYVSGYLLGCILLTLRMRWGEPLRIVDWRRKLAFFAILGLAIYTYRAMLVYAFGVCVPWEWIRSQIRSVLNTQERSMRVLRYAAYFFLSLYVCLSWLGTSIGTFQGRAIKLNANPNLQIAIVLLTFIWSWLHRHQARRIPWRAAIIPAVGFITGFSPEMIAKIGNHEPQDTGARIASLKDALETAILLPDRLRELLTSTLEAPLGAAGQTPLHLASLVLVILSILWLIRHSRTEYRSQFLRMPLALAGLTFCLVSSYSMGNTRWLFSSLPILFIGTGYFTDWAWQAGVRRKVILSILLIAHFGNQLWGRNSLIATLKTHPQRFASWTMGRVDGMKKAIDVFQTTGVPVVVSDDHFWSNNLSVLSGRNPRFVSKEWSELAGYELARTAPQVGLILKEGRPFPFEFRGRVFRNEREIARVDGSILYLAE